MLNLSKSINITGQSMINGTQVVFMSANITTEGGQAPTVNQSIMNLELYNANKEQCRKDIADFQTEVYKIQDSMTGGTK